MGGEFIRRLAAVYKLALLLIALQVIQESFDDFGKGERAMWANQNLENGGVVTGINHDGSPESGPNTETTALVILAYDQERISMLKGRR